MYTHTHLNHGKGAVHNKHGQGDARQRVKVIRPVHFVLAEKEGDNA